MDKSTNSSCLSYLSLESKMDAWAKYAEILIYTSTDSIYAILGLFEVCEGLKANFGQETVDFGLRKHLGPGRADLKHVKAGLVSCKADLRP